MRGRWENFWASEQTSVVELRGAQDIIDKVVYTLTNPVADDLVANSRHWPGASSLLATRDGDSIHACRPRRYFRDDGPCPPMVTLKLCTPPGFEHLSYKEFMAQVQERIAEAEQVAAAERALTGKRVLGRSAILRQPWEGRPNSVEPRRNLDPRVACRNVWRRVEALGRNKLFVHAYHEARELWRAGKLALFPPGTYWLRRFAGVPCSSG